MTQTKIKRNFTGTVVSNKMAKTLVVSVLRFRKHPKYQKRVKYSKKFKAHYDEGNYQVGDKVMIEETRPFSKEVKWQVIQKIENKKYDSTPNNA